MAKQIYIDSNGNEVLVSGTITNDNNLPHYTGTPTPNSTAEAIGSKADKTWEYVDTIFDGGQGCDLSGYNEVLVVPYVNNNSKYNSFVYPIAEISGAVIAIVGSTTHKYVGSFTLSASNILTVTDATINVWTSCYMRIWAR